MKLLVSIHDVSPANAVHVHELWDLCRVRGITPALLVVPNWHGRWPLEDHSAFVAWVRGCASEGAEIFLHGERHDEAALTRTPLASMRAFGHTVREGEFLTLTYHDARARIGRGIQVLRRCGLSPMGFVAPAWLGTRDLSRAVAACGLRYGEDESSIHLLHRATRLRSPVTRWSARTPWRAAISSAVADARWRAEPRAPLVRVALHPGDMSSERVRASIETTLDRWLARHYPWTYAAL